MRVFLKSKRRPGQRVNFFLKTEGFACIFFRIGKVGLRVHNQIYTNTLYQNNIFWQCCIACNINFYTSKIFVWCNNVIFFLFYFAIFGTVMLYLPNELTLPLLIILEDQTIYLIIVAFSCILISLSRYLHINLICTIAHWREISLTMA